MAIIDHADLEVRVHVTWQVSFWDVLKIRFAGASKVSDKLMERLEMCIEVPEEERDVRLQRVPPGKVDTSNPPQGGSGVPPL